jgi:hypothetical protein
MAEAPKPIVFPKAAGDPIPDPPPLPEPGSNIFAYRVQGRMVWVEGVVRTLWTTNVGGTNPGSLPAGLTITGKGAPAASLGGDGMIYFDASSGAVYGPKAAGQWPAPDPASSLKGAKGDPGTAGTPGTNGKSVRNGAGAPNPVVGVVGDFYLDTTATSLYGPKTETGWPTSGVVLKGSGGSGTPGADGRTILSGTGAPGSTTGVQGDFYMDTASTTLWGPKGNGMWPGGGVPLKGNPGLDGVPGKTIRSGSGDPFPEAGTVGDFYIDDSMLVMWGPKKVAGNWTDVTKSPLRASFLLHGTIAPTGIQNPGRDGDFYIDSATSTLYGPRAGGRWPAGVSMKGTAGVPGNPGTPGVPGVDGGAAKLLDAVMGLWNPNQTYPGGSIVYWEDLDGSSMWISVGEGLKGSVPGPPNWKLVSRTTRPTSLAAPPNVRIQAIANKTVDVEWDTVAGATSYRVYLYNGTTGETIQRAAMTSTSTSFGLGNLTTATPYKVRVVARTTSGIEAGAASPFVSFTTTGPAAPPAAGRITHLTTTTATLEWDPSPTPNVTSWNVKQVGASGNPQVVAGSFRTTNLTGLTPNTEYTYEIRATKDLGSADVYGDALICNFTSAPIATPTNLRITPKSTTSMDVEWDYPSGTQVTGFAYQLEYVGGSGSTQIDSNSALRKVTIALLPEGAAVQARVWARIGDAQSEPIEVSGGPALPAPTRLAAPTIRNTNGKTQAQWTYPSNTRATGFTVRMTGVSVAFDETQELGPGERSTIFSTSRNTGYILRVTPKGTPPGPESSFQFAASNTPLREGQ